MIIKKLLIVALLPAFLIQVFPVASACGSSMQLETNAASAILMEPYTGKILFQKNPIKSSTSKCHQSYDFACCYGRHSQREGTLG